MATQTGTTATASDLRAVDAVQRRLEPDVQAMLEAMAALDLPLMHDMPPEAARAFATELNATRPPGPDVDEIVDGSLPGAVSELEYRLYRPPGPGPHPIVVYFHGGGFVIGSHVSDEPFCRDLCVRAGAIFVSVNYRHAPEHRFPAAADDGIAATQWIADNAATLGGVPGQIAIAGWSAGGNIAAVVCHAARDAGGPAIRGQLLVTPATDGNFAYPSYAENSENYVLTGALMNWFLDHYIDRADRAHPKAAPIRAASLANLPPALVVTAGFDPLRDEGAAYAAALAAAGVEARHLSCPGHIHTSLLAVDLVPSGAGPRQEMAAALRGFFAEPYE